MPCWGKNWENDISLTISWQITHKIPLHESMCKDESCRSSTRHVKPSFESLPRVVQETPKNYTGYFVTALDYLLETEGKTLLLKRGHTLETRFEAMELELTWKPSPLKASSRNFEEHYVSCEGRTSINGPTPALKPNDHIDDQHSTQHWCNTGTFI